MKKIIAICLMLAMVFVLSFNVFAAPDGFVSSPSSNKAPEVIEFDPADEDCTARLVITPYSEKDELTGAILQLFEKAYASIIDAKDISKLNEELAKLASSMKIKGENLAVSDLFDIHVTGCDYHDEHVDFDITLKADTLKRFVGLLHMNKDGKWELVKDARVTHDGDHLEFSVDSFSPFAIVVDTTDTNAPLTADNNIIYVVVAIVAISALAVLVIAVKSKKQKA